MVRARNLAVHAVSTLLLAACGSSDAPVDSAAPVATPTVPNLAAEFTAAVAVGNNVAPARVQFKIGTRPALGQPLPLVVRVTPTADVEKLQVFFEAEGGLGFVDESQASFVLDSMKSGTAHVHTLQVLPGQDGVFLLKVNVMTDTGGSSRASEFAIPVLVGAAPAPAAPTPATSTSPPAPGG